MNSLITSRQNAEIITCNKYNQSSNFIFSTFCIDVVFKLSFGSNINITIRNLDLPIYEGQKVELIWVNDSLMAYEDKDTKEAYFFDENPADKFNNPYFNWYSVTIATIAFSILLMIILPEDKRVLLAYLALLPFAFRIYRAISNSYINKTIENAIAN